MSDDNAIPTEYLQSQLGSEYETTKRAQRTVAREAWRRRFFAYTLKAIAALGGLVLAAGLLPPLSQGLGLAITAAVAIDALFSNHLRLLSAVKATQAYRRLLRVVMRTHKRDLAPILVLKQSGDPAAKQQLNALNARLLQELHAGSEDIEAALDETDLIALSRLSLDPEAKTTNSQRVGDGGRS